MNIIYKEFNSERLNEIKEIYKDSSWNAYLKDDLKLEKAFKNSLYVYGAFDDNKLVGFIRVVGDGEHIVLIQDLIVLSNYQKNGIGTTLFKTIWDKYINVRMFQVVTDISDEIDNKFYKSFNMKPIKEGHMISYFR